MNRRISGCFLHFYDILDTWHWIRTVRKFKLIIWFCTVAHVFPGVISRYLESNMYLGFLNLTDTFVWFLRFVVFCVQEYCFHAYVWTIIMLQIVVNLFRQLKIVFDFVIITNLLTLTITFIVIRIWLNCCKVLEWFFCVDKVDALFFWLLFLVCMN